jgi:hypothetical protein
VKEKVKASIKVWEAWAFLAMREGRQRVLKAEAESTASLAFVCDEGDEFTWKVSLLEVELMDASWAQDMDEANF